MEKKIWDSSMLNEEACKRANAQLVEMFPDKELTYTYDEDDEDGSTHYKEYYQDIFNGLYDDIINKLTIELSKEDNNWIKYEEDIDIHFRSLDDNVFEISDGETTKTIEVNKLTIKEVEFYFKEMGYALYFHDIYLSPFMIAVCVFNYTKELE